MMQLTRFLFILVIAAVACCIGLVRPAGADALAIWGETAKLLASDGAVNDRFGSSVAASGDTLVVGAGDEDDLGLASGAAYVFERDIGGGWVETAKLTASDGAEWDRFGSSVAISGDTLVVGATQEATSPGPGSAYVFERDGGGGWLETAKLTASDGNAGDQFGISVAVSGDTVVVGGRYTDNPWAYVFERDVDGSWVETAQLAGSDSHWTDGFGTSVAASEDTVVVGAPWWDGDLGTAHGSAYVFERDGVGWVEAAQLTASDGDASDYFGWSVAASGDTVVVGAYRHFGFTRGAAYVFERDLSGGWLQTSKLTASDGTTFDRFGYSVAVSGTTAVVGGTGNDADSGSVYVFEFDGDGGWVETAALTPTDGAAGDELGTSVAASGNTIVGGSRLDDYLGSAYVWEPVLVSPDLSISGVCPGESTLVATGVTPSYGVRLYNADSPGSHTLEEGPCAGTVLGLEQPLLAGRGRSDYDQEATLARVVAERWCGTFAQVLDEYTCLTSEVVQVPVAVP